MTPMLDVQDLTVQFTVRGSRHPMVAVNSVNFSIGEGETVGLVGESGSGKSTTGRAVLRLLPLAAGSIEFRGQDIAHFDAKQMRPVRRHMQMVFQDPYSSLNPARTVGDAVAEPLQFHLGLGGSELDRAVRAALDEVALPASAADRYPYEFSGGQRQRIAIARAISVQPSLVVCDEAVSALDVATQNQIITLLERIQQSHGCSYLFISHDLSVVRHLCDRVAVMYLGEIVEFGPTDAVLADPQHPYTRALLSAIPLPQRLRSRTEVPVRGDIPDPRSPPPGCRFHTRCPHAIAVCRTDVPATRGAANGSTVACHLVEAAPVAIRAGAATAGPTEETR